MNWIKERNIQESLEILEHLSEVCASIGKGPCCDKMINLVRAGDIRQLISQSIDYSTIELQDALYARQILGFYQKLDIDLGIQRDVVCLEAFFKSEDDCLWANRRITRMRSKGTFNSLPLVDVVLHYAQQKIACILGDYPSPEILEPSFGPGANTNVKADRAFPRGKLSVGLECSTKFSPYVGDFLSEAPAWVQCHSITEDDESYVVPVGTAHGKLSFVPKNAKTYRGIVVEPLLNSFFQKGIGKYIRGRLLRSGLDLSDQTRNQRLACKGSQDDSLATIDLSNASDTLSTELVWALLPFEWAEELDKLRTDVVDLPQCQEFEIPGSLCCKLDCDADGRLTYSVMEKFSSMGNGFTFELESLIFYALTYGVCRALHLSTKDISVYGDDIIIPKRGSSLLTAVLALCGFSVNLEKSYIAGPFRESCGADYFLGFDIRPYYQKTLVSDRTLYACHNWFMRHGERELAASVLPFIRYEKLYGPDGYGDGHLIGSYTLRRNRKIIRDGWSGGFFDSYALKPRSFRGMMRGDCVLPSYSVYVRSGQQSPTDTDSIRGSNGYVKLSIYTLSSGVFCH